MRAGKDPTWQALTFAGGEVELYAVVKGLSDENLDQLLRVLSIPPFGQTFCDRLDSGDTFFNAVATDLQIDMPSLAVR